MKYQVIVKKRALKTIRRMPKSIQERMVLLIDDLRDKGPIRTEWSKFSKLGDHEFHCHLGYKWVACWRWEEDSIVIEVYYAGSRENAPY
jgi:mRNA-degrading endonuclease RelE of RelBE toxin-antitoxin system